MRSEEMKERLDNGERALVVAVDKWRRLLIPSNWHDVVENVWLMGSGTCSLCESYPACCDCPLVPITGDCGGATTDYQSARSAVEYKDNSEFNKYGHRLLGVLEELEEKEHEKMKSEKKEKETYAFTLKKDEPIRKPVQLYLEQDEDGIRLQASAEDRSDWILLSFTPDGIFKWNGIDEDAGLPVDTDGYIHIQEQD